MGTETDLQRAIADLYDVVARLEAMYPGRHFTPDGLMVGSLGEVVAANRYGLDLFEASHPVHDGTAPDGRLVQVKATQGTRIAINEEPEHLIVLRMDGRGGFEEVYNGPGARAWAAAGKLQKTGQRHVSLSRLRELNANVRDEDRIQRAH